METSQIGCSPRSSMESALLEIDMLRKFELSETIL